MKATQSEIWYQLEVELDQYLRNFQKSEIGMPDGEEVQQYIHYQDGKKMISLEYESEKKIFLNFWRNGYRFSYVPDLNIWTKEGRRFTTEQVTNEWKNLR